MQGINWNKVQIMCLFSIQEDPYKKSNILKTNILQIKLKNGVIQNTNSYNEY